MIKNTDILADLHTHTIFSKHAYSTVKENIEEAKKQNLKYIAITDHYYHDGIEIEQKNETCRIQYLEKSVNSYEKNIRVVGSAEFNLHQDIHSWDKLQKLNWRPIGLHTWFMDIPNSNLEDIFRAFKIASDKHNAFVHIERELHKVDGGKYGDKLTTDVKLFLEAICHLAKEKDIFLEVNESSLITNDGGAAVRLKYWLNFAKDNGNKIYLGSDAHYCLEVGKFDTALKLLNEINYPKELILNCNEELLNELFN